MSNIISETITEKNLFELGGPEVFTYKEFYALIAQLMNKKRVFFPITYVYN